MHISKNVSTINSFLAKYVNLAHSVNVQNSEIGLRTSIGRYTKIRDAKIGKYCSISWDCTIGAPSHPIDRIATHAFTYRKQFGISEKNDVFEEKLVEIGNDVWVGCNAIILSGVKIGNGAVIAAGAVVTKDVEPYSIVAGVPAKEIKKRFDLETIEQLQKINWWDLNDNFLKENIDYFTQTLNKNFLIEISNKLDK